METTEKTNSLKEYLGGYPVEITQHISEENYFDVPTLMIGWNSVKHRFPNQDINSKEVTHNLFWAYNEIECKELDENDYYKQIDEFVNKYLFDWLPSDFKLYDSILHGDLHKFLVENINHDELTYVHFNNGALYMRNDDNNFIINVKSLKVTEKDFKFTVARVLNNLNCIIYSYNGIEDYADLDLLSNIRALDIIRWIKFGIETPMKYFQIVPNIDVSKYVPFLMSKVPLADLNDDEERFFKRMCVRDKITRWMSSRYVSFSYNLKKNLKFIYRENAKLSKINYSNKRTLTGRIVSKDKYNPQNLPKEGEERAMIISRYRGGQIYQFDYTSFEARIALYLSRDQEFIERYYDKDLHSETARIIFDTYDFTEEQRDVAKLVNHSILYGASDATILKKLETVSHPSEAMLNVKRFLSPIFIRRDEIQQEIDQNEYIVNKWGSIIKPEKSYAGFNNYIQSTASEIMIDKVYEMKELLNGKKSQLMFQVHDSIIFDIHPEEIYIVSDIARILSYHRGMIFGVNYKSGSNYRDLSEETVHF